MASYLGKGWAGVSPALPFLPGVKMDSIASAACRNQLQARHDADARSRRVKCDRRVDLAARIGNRHGIGDAWVDSICSGGVTHGHRRIVFLARQGAGMATVMITARVMQHLLRWASICAVRNIDQ